MPKAGTNIKTITIGKPQKDGKVTFQFWYKSDAQNSRPIEIKVEVDISKDDTAVEKTAKIVAAINAKVGEQTPPNRGALASQSSIRVDAETTVQLPVFNLINLGVLRLRSNTNTKLGKPKKRKL